MEARKIAVVGVGHVGSTFCYSLMMRGICEEITLISRTKEKALGHALDLNHGLPFVPHAGIEVGDYSACRGAQVIVITAGMAQKPGQSRLDLAGANIRILREILENLLKFNDEAIFVLVSNPVDLVTYAALKISGLPENRVIGTGTVIDTSRFRYLISRYCRVNAHDVQAYVVGEHGDSQVPLWSSVKVGSVPLEKFRGETAGRSEHCFMGDHRDFIGEMTGESAYFVIELKGATNFAISLATTSIVESIFRNANCIMTVSGLVTDAYGVGDICFSLPCVVNARGKGAPCGIPLTAGEETQVARSARILKELAGQLGL